MLAVNRAGPSGVSSTPGLDSTPGPEPGTEYQLFANRGPGDVAAGCNVNMFLLLFGINCEGSVTGHHSGAE